MPRIKIRIKKQIEINLVIIIVDIKIIIINIKINIVKININIGDRKIAIINIHIAIFENWIDVSVLDFTKEGHILTQGDSNLRPLWRNQQP